MRGNVRSFGAGFSTRFLASVSIAVVAAVVATPRAVAAAPAFADACGSANNFDYAVCERLDYMITQQEDAGEKLTLIWWGMWTLAGLLIVLIIAPMFTDSFRFWR